MRTVKTDGESIYKNNALNIELFGSNVPETMTVTIKKIR